MQRIVFACDEVAELLDKTGADKSRKELLAQIEARLALIARQGRAFGIHLILATQRPDANILPGQIKNNMNIRICGRVDTTVYHYHRGRTRSRADSTRCAGALFDGRRYGVSSVLF